MNAFTQKHISFAFVILMIGSSCGSTHRKKDVEVAMKKYDSLIMKMDADGIANLYTPDGDLGTMAHGRDSIKKFLSSFSNVKVLSNSSTSEQVVIQGDSSIQTGNYEQVAVVDGKDTLHLKGEFKAIWKWTSSQGWLIKKMETKPTH
jgi:ketosteroid isomerase-like protein